MKTWKIETEVTGPDCWDAQDVINMLEDNAVSGKIQHESREIKVTVNSMEQIGGEIEG